MFKCAGIRYDEKGTYEEHQKWIRKLRRQWSKVNQKLAS